MLVPLVPLWPPFALGGLRSMIDLNRPPLDMGDIADQEEDNTKRALILIVLRMFVTTLVAKHTPALEEEIANCL